LGEKGAWAYPGTSRIFKVPPIISGTRKATSFKFGKYIHRTHANKSPLKILEKMDRGRIQGLPKFLEYHIHIISYCTFLRRQFKNTGAAAIKQTSKFSAVLQMFLQTVSGHECPLASCSRCVSRRRQMICHIVQFLSAERRASKYQLIACQNDGCRPGDSTQLNTLVHVQ